MLVSHFTFGMDKISKNKRIYTIVWTKSEEKSVFCDRLKSRKTELRTVGLAISGISIGGWREDPWY